MSRFPNSYKQRLLHSELVGRADSEYAEKIKFQEAFTAQIPAMLLLYQLGWHYLSPEQALEARGSLSSEVVLRSLLRQELQKRRFKHAGQLRCFSDSAIDYVTSVLCAPALNEGLLLANENIYNHLLHGITVKEFIDGKQVSLTLPIIDWQTIDNNSFVFTDEFKVLRAAGAEYRIPDLVCFVNGLPLAIIETKHSSSQRRKCQGIDGMFDDAIAQQLHYQHNDEIPHLYAYAQLLLVTNGVMGRYATVATPIPFWASWHEEDMSDSLIHQIKNQSLSAAAEQALLAHRSSECRQWYHALISGRELAITGQDKLIVGLLSRERLLEMTRYFILFDNKSGKLVGRHQQVFSIKRVLQRISLKDEHGVRQGGVVWHAPGTGKSLTMVFLSKALVLNNPLQSCRIVIVSNCSDLEAQLNRTFAAHSELLTKKHKAAAMATSGTRLANQISKGTERIVLSMINKFAIAAKLPECHNESANIIMLLDEGHRSQGGEHYISMRQSLPHAAFIVFTGTPLLKEEKATHKWGPMIHAYTTQQAVADHTITPLLYEERKLALEINDCLIDAWLARISNGLSELQKTALKEKYAAKKSQYTLEDRLCLIAYDMAYHFSNTIDDGLKGQLVCDSKLSAIQYKGILDELGLFESAIVMSEPDARDGSRNKDESHIPAVSQWWKDTVAKKEEKAYIQHVIERFAHDDNLKMLIVIDKLLTDFDVPCNTVLYVDRLLKPHELIQAAARVNRLHPLKQFGVLIDYRGIAAELDITRATHQDLANCTQAGFELSDLHGLYHAMRTQYEQLPRLYDALWEIFKGVNNPQDIEQLRQVLVPHREEQQGKMMDVNRPIRENFYERLNAFSSCLKIALQSNDFIQDKRFSKQDRRHYIEILKQFSSLRRIAKMDANDGVDDDDYSQKIKKMLDQHVARVEVKEPDAVYEVSGREGFCDPADWSEEKTRNETHSIKTRISKQLEENLRDDPYAQVKFSQLLSGVIEEAESLSAYPLKQYLLYKAFEEKVAKRDVEGIPHRFNANKQAQAYFGILKLYLYKQAKDDNQREQTNVEDRWVALSYKVDDIVTTAIAEYSVNIQNIEIQIRKQLLPIVFEECKQLDLGLQETKEIVEQVLQVMREGLNRV